MNMDLKVSSKGGVYMCLGIPGKITQLNGNRAMVEMFGVQREISVMLVPQIKQGDYVMIHAGSAISKMSDDEAEKTIEIYQELREIMNER